MTNNLKIAPNPKKDKRTKPKTVTTIRFDDRKGKIANYKLRESKYRVMTPNSGSEA